MATSQPRRAAAATAGEIAIGVRGHRIRDLGKTEQRRREILRGAARAFAHAGFDATNMDQIARECGLAKGHIYHYFRSKEEIFLEIRVAAVNRLIDGLSAIIAESDDDPASVLRKAIASVIARIFQEEGRFERVVQDPVSLSPENRKRIRSLGRRYEHMFSNIVRSGIDQGVFVAGDPKLMSFVLLRGAFGVAQWYREGGRWKPQWIVERVTTQLLRSVLQKGPTK